MHPLRMNRIDWPSVAALIGFGCLLAAFPREAARHRDQGGPLPSAAAAEPASSEENEKREAAEELLGAKKLTKQEVDRKTEGLALKPAIQTLDLGPLWTDKRWRIEPASEIKAIQPHGIMTGIRTQIRAPDGKVAGTSLDVYLFSSGTAAVRYLWTLARGFSNAPGYQPAKFSRAGDVGVELTAPSAYFVRRNVLVIAEGKGVDVVALAQAIDKIVTEAAEKCDKFTIRTPASEVPKD